MGVLGFSVSEITTLHSTFDEDLVNYRAAGAGGIGIWEFKLPPGEDAASLRRFQESGLKATTCVPGTLSIYPVPTPGSTDPEVRTQELCASIPRLAPFDPLIVLVLTGSPPADVDPGVARETIVDGLRRAARIADAHGLTLGLEPHHRELYSDWSTVSFIDDTLELLAEVDEPNIRLHYDVYHLWDTDDVLAGTRAHASEFAPNVHICDWRKETRGGYDRVLPGDGIMDLPAMLGALDDGGWEGWLDLEIFSDDGTFTDDPHADSLWQADPVDLVRRGKLGVERAWVARTSAHEQAGGG